MLKTASLKRLRHLRPHDLRGGSTSLILLCFFLNFLLIFPVQFSDTSPSFLAELLGGGIS